MAAMPTADWQLAGRRIRLPPHDEVASRESGRIADPTSLHQSRPVLPPRKMDVRQSMSRIAAFLATVLLSWVIASAASAAEPPAARTPTRADNPGDIVLKAGPEEVVFAVRSVMPEHWYANFGYYSTGADQKLYTAKEAGCAS
jgi:hypothetical protein